MFLIDELTLKYLNYFGRNMHKNVLFLLKNSKNRPAPGLRPQTLLFPATEGFASRSPASSDWGISPQTPTKPPIEKSCH